MSIQNTIDRKVQRDSSRRKRAFTLVELLVVIAIIGVLVALLLPAVQAAREAARRSQCLNNLRQVALACINYEDSNETLPPGSFYNAGNPPPGGNYVTEVMPYMELGNVTDSIDRTQYYNSAANAPIVSTAVFPGLICPSDEWASTPIVDDIEISGRNPREASMLWYVGSMGPTIPDSVALLDSSVTGGENGRVSPAAQVAMGCNFGTQDQFNCAPCFTSRFIDCSDDSLCGGLMCRTSVGVKLSQATDGLSNTFLAGETLPYHIYFNSVFSENFVIASTVTPINLFEPINADDPAVRSKRQPRHYPLSSGFKGWHPGGAHMAFGDGSARMIQETIDYFTWNAYGSRAGGEVINDE